jgi:hypothetical protein
MPRKIPNGIYSCLAKFLTEYIGQPIEQYHGYAGILTGFCNLGRCGLGS